MHMSVASRIPRIPVDRQEITDRCIGFIDGQSQGAQVACIPYKTVNLFLNDLNYDFRGARNPDMPVPQLTSRTMEEVMKQNGFYRKGNAWVKNTYSGAFPISLIKGDSPPVYQ